VISVPRSPAGIFSVCVPVRVLFDYSAYVGKFFLFVWAFRPLNRRSLSYALWACKTGRKGVVVSIVLVVLLAKIGDFLYGLCPSLLSTGLT
jgi:hypothetical protein